MLTLRIDEVETQEVGPGLRVGFPLHSAVGTASTASVLIVLEPGAELTSHRDSAEETLIVLAGEIEAHCGGQKGTFREGELVVVPAMEPHGMTNTGDTTARVLGLFSSSTVIATFDEPVAPDGSQVFAIGAPVAMAAPLAGPAAVPA